MSSRCDETSDPDDRLRHEFLSALAREGIDYPPERLEEALVEYAQLKRLVKIVVAAACPPDRAKTPR